MLSGLPPIYNLRVRAGALTSYVAAEAVGRRLHTEAARTAHSGDLPLMIHDLVLAAVFLGMIIAPALLAMRSGREEKDAL